MDIWFTNSSINLPPKQQLQLRKTTLKKCEIIFSSNVRQLPRTPGNVLHVAILQGRGGFFPASPPPPPSLVGSNKLIVTLSSPHWGQQRETHPINFFNFIHVYMCMQAQTWLPCLPKKTNSKFMKNTNQFDMPVVRWTVKGPSPLEQVDVHNIYSQNI
jgi:hypothetical protein